MSEIIQNSQFVKTLKGESNFKNDNPSYTFPFTPDHFQRHAFEAIHNNQNVLILAHTGSGKTVPAIYAAAHHIRKGQKVVYTSPIKALSNQKYKEFREVFEQKFAAEIGREVHVGLMTGDNKIKPDADLVIMTTEILRNELYDIGERGKTKKEELFEDNFLESIGCVIFDEVHYINDKDRGHVWEETIIMLDRSINLVMLSATIDKPEDFAKWIGDIKQKTIVMLPTTHRVVPLEHYIYVDSKLHKIQDKNNNFSDSVYDIACTEYREMIKNRKSSNRNLINETVEFLQEEQMMQAIFFVFSKKNCEKFASSVSINLVNHEERARIDEIFGKYLAPYEEKYSKLPQYHMVKELVSKGIAFHHSGLLFILKEVIEILFAKGYIKVLFATETFAVGVNMPTRTVVFTSLEKYTSEGRRNLYTAEYKQMAGRAGRRGIDKEGNVIILPYYEFPSRVDLRSIMLGKLPHIESKFYLNYSFRLKILQSPQDMNTFLNNSLFQIDTKSESSSTNKVISELEEELKKFEFSEDDLEYFDEYAKLIAKEEEYKTMGMSLNKKQLKQKQKLMKKMNNECKDKYQEYQKYLEVQTKLTQCQNSIDNMNSYIDKETGKLDSVLKELNYINDEGISVKGLLASQINECNELVLTEMISEKMFNGLEPAEICAVLSIFIQDVKADDAISMVQIQTDNENILKTLNKVNEIIEKLVGVEKNMGVDIHRYGYYDVYYDYVDVVYKWASGGTLGEVFDMLEVYEGNFIKNILKVNNIVNDVLSLSKIAGNLEVLPNLEPIEEMLVRDVVTANSLYLS